MGERYRRSAMSGCQPLERVALCRSVMMNDDNSTEAILAATGAMRVKQADGSLRKVWDKRTGTGSIG